MTTLTIIPIPVQLAACAAIVLALNAPHSHAQAWETLQFLPGHSSRAIGVDSFTPSSTSRPNLLVTGDATGVVDADGTPYKIFRLTQPESPDPSAPELGPLHASGAVVHSLAVDSGGTLFWAGGLNTSSGNNWVVRRSGDGGTTWQEIRRWQLSPGSYAEARGITVDDTGSVHVAGLALDSDGVSHWIVETSNNQGIHWMQKALFKGSGAASIPTGYNMVGALGVDSIPGPTGGLFMAGTRGSRYTGAWTVLRSLDGGDTWETVDSWVPKTSGTSRARKVIHQGGRIYVLGDTGGRTESDPSPWVVRMSADSGSTWQTIFGPWSYGPCVYPRDITIDAVGRLWIAGAVTKQYGTSKRRSYTATATLVRLDEGAGGTWTHTEYAVSAEMTGTYSAEASAITTDGDAVYISGSLKASDTGNWHWFIQRGMP